VTAAGNTSYPDGIVLNEFLANPKTDYDDEWVELYNGGGVSADLTGWRLDDGEGGGSPHTLPDGATIVPGGYLVIDLSVALLNNDGDTLRLIRPDGVVVDSTSFTGSAPDASRSRSPDGAWYDGGEPTPGRVNLPPSAQTAPAGGSNASNPTAPESAPAASGAEQVRLNEVLPAPNDAFDAEWIEIANDGDATANLAGWQIDDAVDGGAPFALPSSSTVPPHGLLVVTLPRPLFNNGGDSVRLLRPDGTAADEFSYDGSKPDLSLCWLDGRWLEGCEPTPGSPNEGTADSTPAAGDLAAPAANATADGSILSTGAAPYAERTLATMAAVHQPIQLRGADAGTPIYALALPGSVYTGIWAGTITTPPVPSASAPLHPPAPTRMQVVPTAPAKVPFLPFAGGLAIVVGVGIVAYERLRLRNAALREVGEHVDPDGEPPSV